MSGRAARQSRNTRVDDGETNATAHAAEAAARASYGRLVAILASRGRDIAAAEDALSDAFAKALTTWPTNGVPANPEAWLLTTARNRLTDVQRRDARLVPETDIPDMANLDPADFPDERLKLMFVCAHPAIDRAMHTPLMLQTVLGVQASDIARAFALPPAAMAQRLVRAKSKIKDSGITFSIPDSTDLPARLSAVTEAIYGAYALDWLQGGDALAGEALYLASLLTQLHPNDPEPFGLAALIAFGQSRSSARILNGVLVQTHLQDPQNWDHQLIDYATKMLGHAQSMGQIGRFQIEAAIQSVHAHRANTSETDWQAIAQLTTALHRLYPTLGSAVAQAAAIGRAQNAKTGLALLDQMSTKQIKNFQPFHATQAHLLAMDDQPQAAHAAYQCALELCGDAPSRSYLARQIANLAKI
jgi:RNA polymerase sigma-70 factor (ECF subfamily)